MLTLLRVELTRRRTADRQAVYRPFSFGARLKARVLLAAVDAASDAGPSAKTKKKRTTIEIHQVLGPIMMGIQGPILSIAILSNGPARCAT